MVLCGVLVGGGGGVNNQDAARQPQEAIDVVIETWGLPHSMASFKGAADA